MRRFLIIILVNFILFCITFIILNVICADRLKKEKLITINRPVEMNMADYEVEKMPSDYIQLPYNDESVYEYCGEDRINFGTEEYNTNPIVVFGCSYAYGHGLNRLETFSNLLSHLSKRPVYNFSRCGGDAIYSLKYMKENADLEKIKKADYLVYVYMYDHIYRFLGEHYVYIYNNVLNIPKWERVFGRVPLFKYFFINVRRFKIMKDYPNYKSSYNFHKEVMLYFINQVKAYMPNAKIIIVIYDVKISDYLGSYIKFVSEAQASNVWKELPDDVEVVHTKDITGFVYDYHYKLKEDICDWHPNAKAWQVFTDKFVQNYIK